MNSFNPAEAYVSPHMMSFVGLESSSGSTSSGQRQQLWDWETATQQAPGNTAPLHHVSLFHDAAGPHSNSSCSAFYDCAGAAPVVTAMGGIVGSGGGGGYGSYSFHSPAYPGELIKSEDDGRGGGAGHNIGLNLGHRTYFPSNDPTAVDHLFRRTTRGIYQVSQQVPRCQAEGCNADLSGAKHYHRRHKVCELHSKAAMVIAGGLQQRFCQQCSRFHPLSEFDEAKRSCRRRLAEHNRRRRKSSQTPPTASGVEAGALHDPSTITDRRKDGSPKSMMRNLGSHEAAAREIITGTTGSSISTSSTHSQANISMEKAKDYQKTATLMRNGPGLSLGGAGRAAAAAAAAAAATDKGGCFGFPYQQQQMPWAVMPDENNSSQQQQQRIMSSSSSSSGAIIFQSQNYFCSGSNEVAAGHSTAGGHHQQQPQIAKPPLQLGQGMLEVDFI